MTALKNQAVEMLRDVPDDKMIYVIDILRGLNGLFAESKKINISSPSSDTTLSAHEAWEELKKYKGTIIGEIDAKAELAEARDEKYARSDN